MSITAAQSDAAGQAPSTSSSFVEGALPRTQFGFDIGAGGIFSSEQPAPASFLSSWQSQLASLSMSVESGDEVPVLSGQLNVNSLPVQLSELSTASQFDSKLVPSGEESIDSSSSIPIAAGKPIARASLASGSGSLRTPLTQDAEKLQPKRMQNLTASRQASCSKHVQPDLAVQNQTSAANANELSVPTLPTSMVASVLNTPEEQWTLHTQALPASQQPEAISQVPAEVSQKHLEPDLKNLESNSVSSPISAAEKDEASFKKEASSQDDGPRFAAAYEGTHSCPPGSGSTVSTPADLSSHSLPPSTPVPLRPLATETSMLGGDLNQSARAEAGMPSESSTPRSAPISDPTHASATVQPAIGESVLNSQPEEAGLQGSPPSSLASLKYPLVLDASITVPASAPAAPPQPSINTIADQSSEESLPLVGEHSTSSSLSSALNFPVRRPSFAINEAEAAPTANSASVNGARPQFSSNASSHARVGEVHQGTFQSNPPSPPPPDYAIASEPDSLNSLGQKANSVAPQVHQASEANISISQSQLLPPSQPRAHVATPGQDSTSADSVNQALDPIASVSSQPPAAVPKAAPPSASKMSVRPITAHATLTDSLTNPSIHATQSLDTSAVDGSSALLRDPATGHSILNQAPDALSSSPSHSSPYTREAFAALDSTALMSPPAWIHTGSHRAEAGFQDPSLGWVGVRADASGGQLHATLVPASTEAVQQLGGHLAGLQAHLAETHTHVDSFSIAASENGEPLFGTSPDQNQGMHQGADPNGGQGRPTQSIPETATPAVQSSDSLPSQALASTQNNPLEDALARSDSRISVIA